MTDEPLQPFSPPTSLSAFLPDGISSAVLVEWLLYIVFVFWAIYTLVAIYHWLKYSHASWIAFPAIAVHLFVSFVLAGFALSGTLPIFL
jgi:hypothetical protein